MKSLFTNRKAGVYVLIVSILLQLVSAVNYLSWAPGAGGIDMLVALGLGLGCLAGIAAFLFSSDLLLVADTALCSCGLLKPRSIPRCGQVARTVPPKARSVSAPAVRPPAKGKPKR